jgi:hypothetical protein
MHPLIWAQLETSYDLSNVAEASDGCLPTLSPLKDFHLFCYPLGTQPPCYEEPKMHGGVTQRRVEALQSKS